MRTPPLSYTLTRVRIIEFLATANSANPRNGNSFTLVAVPVVVTFHSQFAFGGKR